MKKILKYFSLLFVLITILLINSCQEDVLFEKYSYRGNAEFGFTVPKSETLLKSTFCDFPVQNISAAIVSIEDENGELVYNFEEIELYKFDECFISKPLSFKAGSYKLIKYLLLDSDDKIIYAAPLITSDKAYLVDKPLPIEFNIEKDSMTKVVPEVLSAMDSKPEDFGYSTFGFEIAGIFNFQICIMIYNDLIKKFELTDAKLLITCNDDTLFDDKLKPLSNNITLKDEYAEYEMNIFKSGYLPYSETYSADSLKGHYNNPLIIILDKYMDLVSGIVAYYPCNGNANDESGNNNHGLVSGAVSDCDRFGNANGAYYFDGMDDYATFNDTAFDFIDQFSISFWLNTSSTGFDQRWFFKNFDPPDRSWFLSLNRVYEGRFTFFTSEDGTNAHEFTSDSIFNDSIWNHVVLVYYGNQNLARFYKNSKLAGEDTVALSKLNLNDIKFSISNTNYYGNWAHGSIDDIRIYNRALSDYDIYTLYME